MLKQLIKKRAIVLKTKKRKGSPAKMLNLYKPVTSKIGHGKHCIYSYADIYSDQEAYDKGTKRGYRFTLLDSYNQMLLPWVACKDFFNDIMYSQIYNLNGAGFDGRYKGLYISSSYYVKSEYHKLDFTGYYKIAIKNGDWANKKFQTDFFKAFKLLKLTYKELGLDKPKIAARFNESGKYIYIVYLPNRLFLAGPLISFSLTILRTAGGFKNINPKEITATIMNGDIDVPGYYLKRAGDFYQFCIDNGIDKVFTGGAQENWPEFHLLPQWNKTPGGSALHCSNGHDHMIANKLLKVPYYSNFIPSENYIQFKEKQ